MLRIVAALVAAFAFSAVAAEKTFTWTAPTTYVNGDPLPAAEIAGYTLACGALSVPVNGPVTSFKRDFAPGDYTCTLATRSIFGGTSAPSNAVSFTVPRPLPNAPAGLSVD